MTTGTLVAPRPRSIREIVVDYGSLTKPKIIVWLEITTICAMIMAQRGLPSLTLMGLTLAGGWLAASASNTVNCWYDRDIDHEMARTRGRPVADGRIAPSHALIFGITLLVLSNLVLVFGVNILSALLADSAFVVYIFVYTIGMKRRSVQNIVIGGAAGAIPPLVGWAAVTDHIGIGALALFAIIFYWTPPHFWALALLIERDYSKADVPMLPVVAGDRYTKINIVLYTALLAAVTMIPFFAHTFGMIYFVCALVLDGGFLALAIVCAKSMSRKAPKYLFLYSLAYLALLFVAMSVDRVIGS